jgi:hypothetical protein
LIYLLTLKVIAEIWRCLARPLIEHPLILVLHFGKLGHELGTVSISDGDSLNIALTWPLLGLLYILDFLRVIIHACYLSLPLLFGGNYLAIDELGGLDSAEPM